MIEPPLPCLRKRKVLARCRESRIWRQAQSNRGRRGWKKDFPDALRLVKRLVAQELVLSFMPDPEQRLWRAETRRSSK
jgi:hypothetical protein